MVPFSGWEMPLQYKGIIEEHVYTREKVSIFDICHMGEFIIKGETAFDDIDSIVTCRLDDLQSGKARYGFILDDNGCIIDDMIIFRMDETEFMIVVNAGTVAKDSQWIRDHISSTTEFTDISGLTAKIDIQGPRSPEVLSSVIGHDEIRGLKRFNFRSFRKDDTDILVSATGYTGERGYELFISSDRAGWLWNMLLAGNDVKAAGLGARDSLRLEMGYSLYGHDIDQDHTPVEAGLMRFVYTEKEFIGKSRISDQLAKGPEVALNGFICEGRRSPREGFEVKADGYGTGRVTSGVFSPCLKKGVGLCYIEKGPMSDGDIIYLSSGGISIPARIKTPPFVGNK